MKLRPLQGLFWCVLAATVLVPSLGEVAASRNILETFSENVVGGEQAAEGRYRYACIVETEVGLCTGFLVHPNIIVTAAHCGTNGTQCFVACGGMKIDESDAQHSYYGKFVANPSYVDLPGYHDVAMIDVDGDYSTLPLPIVSRDGDEFKHGRLATAMGWGDIKEIVGPLADKLKIARDIIPTDLDCDFALPTLCGISASGRAASGDSGGPLVIEGDSAETDIVFGITSAGLSGGHSHVMYFTNLPCYLDKFISPYLRLIETETVAALIPKGRPKNPTIESVGNITATANDCSVTFTANNTAKKDKATIKWGEVVRSGSKVAFDIAIDGFAAEDLADLGFILDVYEDISLYVHGDGEIVAWIKDGDLLAYSLIKPGSGIHKVRIENTETGYEIYEDRLKSAVVDIPFPRDTVVARFDTIVKNAGLSYTISIASIRMIPAPAVLEEEGTLASGPEVEEVPALSHFYLRPHLSRVEV